MIEETPVRTRVFEYRAPPPPGAAPRDGDLAAVCLTDVLDDGLSLVYSFYDPALADKPLKPTLTPAQMIDLGLRGGPNGQGSAFEQRAHRRCDPQSSRSP